MKRGQCKLSRTLSYSTHAWWYAPEQKLLVLADGLQPGSQIRAWFLKSTVGTNLPRLELPPPDKCPRFALPQAPGMEDGLRPADVALVSAVLLSVSCSIPSLYPYNTLIL